MKNLILILTLLTFSYSEQYTFLVNKYDKEIELEAKIVSNIAISSLNNNIKLFMPNATSSEKNIYSKFFKLSDNCEDANFVYVKKSVDIQSLCKNENKLFFTNNYDRLLSDNRYFGAFFWHKSRPNITFIKNRLASQNIILPVDYENFIEDIDR